MKQHIKDVCCGVTFMTKSLEVMVAVVDVGICCPMLYSLRLEMKQHSKDDGGGVALMTKIMEVVVAVVDVGRCYPMLYSLRLAAHGKHYRMLQFWAQS